MHIFFLIITISQHLLCKDQEVGKTLGNINSFNLVKLAFQNMQIFSFCLFITQALMNNKKYKYKKNNLN